MASSLILGGLSGTGFLAEYLPFCLIIVVQLLWQSRPSTSPDVRGSPNIITYSYMCFQFRALTLTPHSAGYREKEVIFVSLNPSYLLSLSIIRHIPARN